MLLVDQRRYIKLKELRELLGQTQQQFSRVSGKNQSSISKIESRADLQFSTIERFVADLGGQLEIKAHFEDFDVPILLQGVGND